MAILSPEDMSAKVEKFQTNMDRLDGIINGANNADVAVDTGTVFTISKLIKIVYDNMGTKVYDNYVGGLALATGLYYGQPARVNLPGTPATHVDPVTGATVSNKGYYAWNVSPAGWKWVTDYETIDETNIRTQNIRPQLGSEISRGLRMLFSVRDKNNKIAAGVTPRGLWYARGFLVGKTMHFRRQKYMPLVTDQAKRLIMGLTRNGELYVRKFDAATLAQLNGGGQNELSTWADGYNSDVQMVYNARNGKQWALIRENLVGLFSVMRKTGNAFLAGLVMSTFPMQWRTRGGQSNAGGSGTTLNPATLNLNTYFPHHVMMFAVQRYARRGTAGKLTPAALTDFVPLKEFEDWNSSGVLAAFALEMLKRKNGIATYGSGLWQAWEGGTSLDMHIKPDPTYSASLTANNFYNLVEGARQIPVIAATYGRKAIVSQHVHVGHEGAMVTADPFGTADQFGPYFQNTHIPTAKAEIKAATGQTEDVHMLFWQTVQSWDSNVTYRVDCQQAAVGRFYNGAGATLIGPLSPYPVDPDAADGIHTDSLGRHRAGEYEALVSMRQEQGIQHIPMQVVPGTVTIVGNKLIIPISKPYGAGALAIDTDMAPVLRHNFQVKVGGLFVNPGANPAIVGETVEFTLPTAPGAAAVELWIGQGGGTINPVLGWARSRVPIYRNDEQISPYWALGIAVPKFIRHYLIGDIIVVQ